MGVCDERMFGRERCGNGEEAPSFYAQSPAHSERNAGAELSLALPLDPSLWNLMEAAYIGAEIPLRPTAEPTPHKQLRRT